MHKPHTLRALLQAATRRTLLTLGLVMGLSACMGVAGAAGTGGDSWQEEVLLHDGQKMVVERSQTYGGRHEVGQSVPAKEHTIRFKLPNSSNAVTWTSEYGEGLGRTNFNLLALHIKQGTPYLIVEPNLCLSYNKWGRPNPPYLIFKWEASTWSQINMAELPPEFNTINLIVNNSRIEEIQKSSQATGYVPAEYVKVMNGRLPQPEYRSILREPIANGNSSCRLEFTNGKGRWLGADWFSEEPNLASCQRVCVQKEFSGETCPCKQFFKGE
jgi:hypothetical protein